MQNLQEAGKCVARDLANLGLVHQGLVEELRRILLLGIFAVRDLLALLILLLLRRRAGDIEAHLDKLVFCAGGLLTPPTRASQPIRLRISIGEGEVHGHLVLAGQVCV